MVFLRPLASAPSMRPGSKGVAQTVEPASVRPFVRNAINRPLGGVTEHIGSIAIWRVCGRCGRCGRKNSYPIFPGRNRVDRHPWQGPVPKVTGRAHIIPPLSPIFGCLCAKRGNAFASAPSAYSGVDWRGEFASAPSATFQPFVFNELVRTVSAARFGRPSFGRLPDR
jgi:hypothetical protein